MSPGWVISPFLLSFYYCLSMAGVLYATVSCACSVFRYLIIVCIVLECFYCL